MVGGGGGGGHERPGADRFAHGPPKQSFDAGYYVTENLQKSRLSSLAWDTSTGSVLTKKMVPGILLPIFHQDGASAHTSMEAQQWCQENVKVLGHKHMTRELTRSQFFFSKISGEY